MSFSEDLCFVKFPHSFGSGSILEIEPQDSVSELVKELWSQRRRSSQRGAWLLLETWHHCSKLWYSYLTFSFNCMQNPKQLVKVLKTKISLN